MRTVLKLILLVLLAIPSCARAQRIPISANLTPAQMYDKAINMLNSGFTDKGLGYLKMAAGKHNIPALKYLGQCYLDGKYVTQDKQEAGRVFEIAAKLGDVESASILAQLTKNGAFVPDGQTSSDGKQVVQVINHFDVVEAKPTVENAKDNMAEKLQNSDVDVNIPTTTKVNNNTFAVIISNENYQEEVKVDYAIHDGQSFSDYCNKTLGIPRENIHFRKDATYNNIKSELDWISQVADAYNGKAKVIFYYAGHGFPDESTKTSYLLPVDGKGNIVGTGYSLAEIYKLLGNLPVENVVVFLDACFSGSQRGDGMLASARGIAIKAKPSTPKGKMVVFSAAKDDETAYPYKEKHHGLFTYYLLKGMQATKGDCTLGELSNYIHTNVTQKSIVANGKSQTPTVAPSESERESWKSLKLN